MKILDLCAGTGSATQAFEDAGHDVLRVDNDRKLRPELVADVREVAWREGAFDFVWASPPCEAFSVASIGTHWTGGHRAYVPKTEHAERNMEIVQACLRIIDEVRPVRGWVMENPRGVLRKLPIMAGIDRATVTYCHYGDERMKPTDLWGTTQILHQIARPMCHNAREGHSSDCCCRDHDAAPRGAKTGTQGRNGASSRGMVPYELSQAVLEAVTEEAP